MTDKAPHGGNIYEASEKFGIDKKNILDYSANINPLGLPESMKEIIASSIENLVNYPDPYCNDLKAEISRYLNIGEENIIVGNGASEIIFLFFDTLHLRKVLMPAPTFSEYARAARGFNIEIDYFELREDESFRLNVDRLVSHMGNGVDALLLCNPNNPTSTLSAKEDILGLLEFARRNGIFVIIDEAFIELTVGSNENSMVEALAKFDNLFIIRAFTKVFAIPGLRLGYGLGSKTLIRKMWERKQPWSVNSLACSMGKLLAEESDYLARTRQWLEEETEWFYNELNRIPGLKVFKPQTNFVLIKILVDGFNSVKLRSEMAYKGILIRDAGNFMFLNDKFVRLAIKDRKSNVRLLSVLSETLKELTDDSRQL